MWVPNNTLCSSIQAITRKIFSISFNHTWPPSRSYLPLTSVDYCHTPKFFLPFWFSSSSWSLIHLYNNAKIDSYHPFTLTFSKDKYHGFKETNVYPRIKSKDLSIFGGAFELESLSYEPRHKILICWPFGICGSWVLHLWFLGFDQDLQGFVTICGGL